MRWIITLLLLVITNISFAQEIKHFEAVSEIEDSMVLINKTDVDKINKTFFERNQLDSLNKLNEELILNLKEQHILMDSIIREQKCIIEAKETLTREQLDNNKEFYEKTIKQERNKKLTWQITSGVSWLIIILLII